MTSNILRYYEESAIALWVYSWII